MFCCEQWLVFAAEICTWQIVTMHQNYIKLPISIQNFQLEIQVILMFSSLSFETCRTPNIAFFFLTKLNCFVIYIFWPLIDLADFLWKKAKEFFWIRKRCKVDKSEFCSFVTYHRVFSYLKWELLRARLKYHHPPSGVFHVTPSCITSKQWFCQECFVSQICHKWRKHKSNIFLVKDQFCLLVKVFEANNGGRINIF